MTFVRMHRLHWEAQQSGSWLGISGTSTIAIVSPAHLGMFEWRLRVPASPTVLATGKSQQAGEARQEADAAWSSWLAAHGLSPTEPDLPEGASSVREAATTAALSAYRSQVRAIVERGYHDAYEEALIRTVLDANERTLKGRSMSETDVQNAFNSHYSDARRRVDEARRNWGPLMDVSDAIEKGSA